MNGLGVVQFLIWIMLIFAGVDVTANQEEISDHETFQLEFDDMANRWYIRTIKDKYFTLQPAGGVQASDVCRFVVFNECFAQPGSH